MNKRTIVCPECHCPVLHSSTQGIMGKSGRFIPDPEEPMSVECQLDECQWVGGEEELITVAEEIADKCYKKYLDQGKEFEEWVNGKISYEEFRDKLEL